MPTVKLDFTQTQTLTDLALVSWTEAVRARLIFQNEMPGVKLDFTQTRAHVKTKR